MTRDAWRLLRGLLPRRRPARPGLLVTAPFLATGGAEHTLLETLRVLRGDFEVAIATLAPHRPELGDRRRDFEDVVPHVHPLGDLLPPRAMPAVLRRLIDVLGVRVLYNANSTTLFYDFGPGLKAHRPHVRFVDHLYDHRVGYVERYADPSLLRWIDACVAENRQIARVLVGERGWPADRVPVVWPCGRRRQDLPENAGLARREVRRELGIGQETVVVLTAARLHPQKRPLDLVALAERLRGEDVLFLLAGGGPLADEVDAAIAAAPDATPIRRLPFRDDIPRLVAAADAGCLVSDYEGLPVFMIECLQAGRPFVGTDVGDVGVVLQSTGAGLVVRRPGDLDGLEQAVRRLLDPRERTRLGLRAREAGREFDVEVCAERYRAALRGEGGHG